MFGTRTVPNTAFTLRTYATDVSDASAGVAINAGSPIFPVSNYGVSYQFLSYILYIEGESYKVAQRLATTLALHTWGNPSQAAWQK